MSATTIDDVRTRCRLLVDRLNMPPTGWRDLLLAEPDSWKRWADALDALESDPAASVPE